jgi:hypothetical protein
MRFSRRQQKSRTIFQPLQTGEKTALRRGEADGSRNQEHDGKKKRRGQDKQSLSTAAAIPFFLRLIDIPWFSS